MSSFQVGGTKLERFLPKNQHTQTKIIEFFIEEYQFMSTFFVFDIFDSIHF